MRTKRMISFLLALVMVLAVVPNFALADNEETEPAEAVTYTVTFDANGGTAVSPVPVKAGATVAAPQIERDGFELTGWYTTAVVDGQSVAAEYDFSTPVTSDLKLQAQWSAIVPKNIKMSSKGLMTVLGASSAVAKIGNEEYATLEAAVKAAVDGDTITVLADCAGNGIQVLPGRFNSTGLTIDFGGHTYTVDGTTVGSTGTETQAFQLQKDNKITFQNGTITSTTAKMLVQNYSNLTLNKMTLDGSKLTDTVAYTLSTNNGSTTINDSTITAKTGGFAFDVCSFGTYTGNSVKVTGNSTINGNVEISSSNVPEGGLKLVLESGTITGKLVNGGITEDTVVTGTKADGFVVADSADFKWVNGTLTAIEYVAQIGNEKYETLAAAIAEAEADDTIKLLTDSDTSTPIYITKTITIDGQNHKIAVNSTIEDRVIDISDTSNVTLTLKNVTVDASNCKKDQTRGVSMYGNTNVKLVLDNASINCPYYAINVASANDGVEVEVKNSSVASGWAAINVWSPAKITVSGSELSGTNDKSYNAAGQNNFSTIMYNSGSTGSELTVTDSTISAATQKGNGQWFARFTSNNSYEATFTNCTFVQTGTANGGKTPDAMFVLGGTQKLTFTNCTAQKDGESVNFVNALFEKTRFESYPALYSDYIIDGIQYVVGVDGAVREAVPGTVQRDAEYKIIAGTFYADNDPTETLAEGYIAEQQADDSYIVRQAIYVAQIGETKYETLDAAYNAAHSGDTIKLLGDITYGVDREVAVWDKAVNLDLGGYTLTTNSEVSVNVGNMGYKAAAICYSIPASSAGSVTVSNGTIVTAYGAGVYADDPGLTLTLENLTIRANTVGVQTTEEYSSAIRITGGAKVIINSGSYSGHNAIAVSNSGGEFEITGGKFSGNLYISSYCDAGKTQKISISGGYFTADPQNYLAEGYDKKKTEETGYVWEVGEHIHNFTNGEPNWLWTVINGTWSASSTYTGTCKCGESGTETLTATVVKTEETDSVIIYTATDENGKKDTKTFQKTFTVTYGGLERTYLYGAACKLESGPASDWKVNGSTRAVGTAIFYFPVTEDVTVTSTPSTESTQQPKSNVNVETSVGKMVYKFTWSIPEGSQVVSAVIYRCRDDASAINSFEALSNQPNLRTYDTKMYVRNGEFTFTVTGLTPGSKQTIMFHLVYTLDGQTYTMNTDISHVEIPSPNA